MLNQITLFIQKILLEPYRMPDTVLCTFLFPRVVDKIHIVLLFKGFTSKCEEQETMIATEGMCHGGHHLGNRVRECQV